jgi:hypothetical protein
MTKTLPCIAIQIQQKMRDNSEIKIKYKVILKELVYIFDDNKKLKYVREKIDTINNETESINISCKKGCSHCCHHEISASTTELKSIYKDLTQNQLDKFKYQSGFLNQSDIEYSLRSCPLLKSNN